MVHNGEWDGQCDAIDVTIISLRNHRKPRPHTNTVCECVLFGQHRHGGVAWNHLATFVFVHTHAFPNAVSFGLLCRGLFAFDNYVIAPWNYTKHAVQPVGNHDHFISVAHTWSTALCQQHTNGIRILSFGSCEDLVALDHVGLSGIFAIQQRNPDPERVVSVVPISVLPASQNDTFQAKSFPK